MNKQQLIDRLYELVADKTLSFGCVVSNNHRADSNPFKKSIFIKKDIYLNQKCWLTLTHLNKIAYTENKDNTAFKIIGHPPTLSRILEKFKESCQQGVVLGCTEAQEILSFYNLSNDTPEGQSKETLKFLIDLFK